MNIFYSFLTWLCNVKALYSLNKDCSWLLSVPRTSFYKKTHQTLKTVLYTVNSRCQKGRTPAANMKHMKEIHDTCDLTRRACLIPSDHCGAKQHSGSECGGLNRGDKLDWHVFPAIKLTKITLSRPKTHPKSGITVKCRTSLWRNGQSAEDVGPNDISNWSSNHCTV